MGSQILQRYQRHITWINGGRFRRPCSRSAPTACPAWWDGVSHVVTRPARLDHLRAVGPLAFRWITVFREPGGPTARKWSNRTQVVQPHVSGPTEHKWSKQGSTAMTPLNNLPGTSPLTRSVCHVPPPSTTPLFLCYASSPFATLPFLVQWRVKERSRAKGAQTS